MQLYIVLQNNNSQMLGAREYNQIIYYYNSSLYLYGPSGKINKWKNHSPDQVNDDPHIDQSIYIRNCDFETVEKYFF